MGTPAEKPKNNMVATRGCNSVDKPCCHVVATGSVLVLLALLFVILDCTYKGLLRHAVHMHGNAMTMTAHGIDTL